MVFSSAPAENIRLQRGFILDAVRRLSRAGLTASLFFVALSALVFAINWDYLSNWVSGPFPLSVEMAEGRSSKVFAQIPSGLIATSFVIQRISAVRLLNRLSDPNALVAGKIYIFPLQDKILLIKTSPSFSDSSVQGRLVPIPETFRLTLPAISASNEHKVFYPMMLDASFPYRLDANLFVIFAVFAAPFGLFGTLVIAAGMRHPELGKTTKYIRRQRPALYGIRLVEDEILAAGPQAKVGPLYISKNWIFDSRKPYVFGLNDIVAITATTKLAPRTRTPVQQVEFWLVDDQFPHSVQASAAEAEAIQKALIAKAPWIITDRPDVKARWRHERDKYIAEVEKRRAQHNAPAPTS
jgi:hypothetical protein